MRDGTVDMDMDMERGVAVAVGMDEDGDGDKDVAEDGRGNGFLGRVRMEVG
jgi:hypothetical protein